MRQQRLAIIGFGKLGRACAETILTDEQLALAGIVRRAERVMEPLPAPLQNIPSVSHIAELDQVDAALICVPAEDVLGKAQELIQHGVPIVECASLHDAAFQHHKQEIDRLASRRKVAAIVGAGWDPGALSLLRALFMLLTPIQALWGKLREHAEQEAL